MAPLRTCIGCRRTGERADLVRVVVEPFGAHDEPAQLVVDEHGSLPGRGAWLHRERQCFSRAAKRQAFTRALRLQGVANVDAVREWFESHCVDTRPTHSA